MFPAKLYFSIIKNLKFCRRLFFNINKLVLYGLYKLIYVTSFWFVKIAPCTHIYTHNANTETKNRG